MTSRKNQQAARQYMREHDVPYMEALRRVTQQSAPPRSTQVRTVPGRPLDAPLVLGYTPPRHEDAKPSLLGRFRKKSQEDLAPVPYPVSNERDAPRFVTVYGPPGTGKTMLLRSILEQFRGYAAYVVHDGYLLDGPTTLPDGRRGDRVEPWEGLTEINLRPWLAGLTRSGDPDDVPTPPSVSKDLPFGALVVFDLGGARNLVQEEEGSLWPHDRVAVDTVRPWLEFEKHLGRVARSKAITVATSVMTDSRPQEGLPLSLLASPLMGPSTKVRMMHTGFPGPSPEDPWVYEAVSPSPHAPGDHFMLTEREALQVASTPGEVRA